MAAAVAALGVAVGPVNEVVKAVVVPLFLRPLGYLVHHKRNVNEFREKMFTLERQKTSVQRLVDVARERGQDIKEEVSSWISKVNATELEAVTVVVRALGVAIQQNNGCLWDCGARYSVGKGAKIKIDEVNDLLRERDKFGDTVSIPPTAPRVIESMPLMPNFQVFEPTNLAMNQIREALEDKKFNLVGVYGMGGVGKTTLMKEMAKQLNNKGVFDRVVMVTVSQNLILKKIQNDIGENLGYKFREENESVRASRLLERIKHEARILIILDDLWEELPLREVGIPFGDKEDCSVIITTRFLDVCGNMNTQCNVEVKDLPEEDAFRLFRMFAGECVDSLELHDVAKEVVKECGGLPVAIVTVGKALQNKDRTVWVDAITQLKEVIPSRIPGMLPRVFSSIKYSYDRLENQETQLCFLFCCLFPEDFIISEDDLLPYVLGENIFEAIETMKKARNRLHTVLETLKWSCLLLNVDEKKGCVRMHDVVRDVAIWIAKEDHGFIVEVGKGLKEWPDNMKNLQKCKRLSLMQNEISKLPEQMSSYFQLMTTLSLRHNPKMEIPSKSFEGMISLKVLDLQCTNIVSIPSSFSRLTELRVLLLRYTLWEGTDLSLLGNMKKLEMLHLCHCELSTLPQEIGGLTNLRSLDLSTNPDLIIPPKVLSRLSRLEELNLFDSFNEWEIEGSEEDGKSKACLSEVASLSGLTKLILEVSNIECLSSTFPFRWENLTQFFIMIGRFYLVDADDLRRGCYSARMGFYRLTIPELSNWAKGLLGRTENLHFTKCRGLRNIYPGLDGGNGLYSLKSLKIKECEDLEHILIAEEESVHILAFNRLEELELSDIRNLSKICHGRFPKGCLENLRILSIFQCHNLKHIFEMSMAQGLPQLEQIEIFYCDGLEEIFMKNEEGEDKEGKVVLPRLRVLELDSLPNFSTVCRVASLRDFPVFERLYIYKCPNLKGLPISLSPKSTPYLKEIVVEETWFNQLEWDEPSDKLHLQEWVKVNFVT
ncbi:disease resistance protein At4g27190-like [Macadamia integrifolia]|uniref:disease resistance protein At4g27190-like n=1 Tax=Macadamia integrifolia TaxID=60698 RepID=UPI001C52C971|nr:disease resistance protein At4g27190-like [Macadamia integrifolia]XP_042475742.1 disease resistance protein At4g27190-like [Macadamia integrifolia]XP_042475743.1 disease resistance protein At4g27190-like [Macadamia integrifolia]XP_042475745.1 disease resistance protein At4g27190-like [Macadamia integrifolia]